MSVTKSAVPVARTSPISSRQIWVMCSSSRPIIRGVNPRLTNARCLVCCGGSMFSIMSRCIAAPCSGTSPNTTSRLAEEKSSGCLDR